MANMSPNPQALLSHVEWVRGLASCLVSDPHKAEDLAQDAWVSALQSQGQVLNMRGWLGKVLRNLVRQDRRAAGRRSVRELASARPDRVPPTADLVERVSSHRAVVEAVLQLDEPYRTAVLLRFFENMPPRRIGQELEIPVSTVHTRIQRGLTMLRARLDHLHGGDRRSWLVAVLPLARKEGGAAATVLGALYMKTKLQILFGVLVVAIGLVAAWPLVTGGGGEPAQAGGPDLILPPLTAVTGDEARQTGEIPRTVLAETASTVTEEAAEPVATAVTVHGRLVDSEARPLPDMNLQFGTAESGEPPVATSGDQGEFEFLAVGVSGQIGVAQEGWTTVMSAQVNVGRPPEHALVVAAPAIILGGRVVDEFGMPVTGAAVQLQLPEGFRTRFTENSDAARDRNWRAMAAEDGSFELPAAGIAGALLVATNPGYDSNRRPLPVRGDMGLEIVMRRTSRAAGTVFGQVLDAVGAVVADAWVGIGASSTTSDEQGNFTLNLTAGGRMGEMMNDLGAGDRILAVKEGYRPARLAKPRDAVGQVLDWPANVVLRLGEAPLSIAGRVIDENGESVSGVRVWINDPTVFGNTDRNMATLEGLMAGSTTRWDFVRTDDSGGFELGGLADREYRLRAMVDETLLMVDTDPVAAGEQSLVIQVPAGAYYETVAGRVVSSSGMPVAGVTVIPQGDPFRLQIGGQTVSTSHASSTGTITDAQGRFELKSLPRTDVYLRLDGEDILPLEYGRGVEGGIETLSGGAVENLLVTVSVRVHVQVELDDPNSADQIQVLDVERQLLPINVFAGNSRRTSRELDLVDGRTPVMVLPDHATTMVFLKNGTEVKTVNLGLIPGEVNRIRW